MDDDGDNEGALDLFQEPSGYFQAEKQPTFVDYRLKTGQCISLRLIGHSPLWVRGSDCCSDLD